MAAFAPRHKALPVALSLACTEDVRYRGLAGDLLKRAKDTSHGGVLHEQHNFEHSKNVLTVWMCPIRSG